MTIKPQLTPGLQNALRDCASEPPGRPYTLKPKKMQRLIELGLVESYTVRDRKDRVLTAFRLTQTGRAALKDISDSAPGDPNENAR